MTEDAMVLDGNAAAGALATLFAFDATEAIIHCGTCRAAGPLANLRFHGSPRAMVLRCRVCGEVNIRLLQANRSINLDLSGTARMEISSGP